MRKISRFLILILMMFSCQKETLKNTPEYQRFVGHWENIYSNEKVIIDFEQSGEINIQRSGERSKKYYPNIVYSQTSIYETNGIPWEQFYFDKIHNDKAKVTGHTMTINKTSDSMYFDGGAGIQDFVRDSTFTILLLKK